MKFFEALDIYSVAKPVFWLSKFLGLAPFVTEGNIGSRKLRLSCLALIYSLIMLIAQLSRQVFFMWNLCSFNNLESLRQTATTIEAITCNVTVSVFFLMNLLNRRKVYEVFSKLANFDVLSGDMHQTYRKSLFCVIGQVGFHIIFLSSVGITAIKNGALNVYADLLQCISVSVNILLVLVVDLEIINLAFALKQRFSALNNRLSEYVEETDYEFPVSKRWIKKSSLSSVHTIPQVIQVKSFAGISSVKLKNISDLHDFLCDTSVLVNSTYSIHILFDVVLKFIAIIFSVYFRLLRVINYNRGRYEDNVYEGIMVAILFWNILQLTALVWACKSASEEVSLS
jgi:hypothetical protein